MCGLIAILNRHAGGWTRNGAEDAIARGLHFMRHRGLPDRYGIDDSTGATMGHVRLPIVDLSPTWDQPVEVNGITTAFVGEIFNYQDFDAKSSSDTPVIADRFARFGLDGFHAFDGFWSAVFARGKKVTAVTDYLGQKPLYYHAESLMVASEPAALAYALDRPLELDPVFFSNVRKWGYDPTGRTPFAGIRQLAPGHALVYDEGLCIKPYWDWQRVPYEEDLMGLLVEATHARLIGDREVALLLSGGLDSTLVFRILVETLGEEVKVFHAENNEDEFLEAALSGYPSTALHAPPVTLDDAIDAHQVPVDLGSVVPQLGLAKALRAAEFYVCMSGDGADELFGGYRRAKEYDSQGSDTFVELPYYHLPRLDRIMMRETIELRTPYLSPRVIRHAMLIPWERRKSKEALKDVAMGLVPDAIIHRAKHPLKTEAVATGGLAYRELLIEIWKRRMSEWSLW